MAEFVQTMKDWHRMCENCDRNEEIGCVVNGSVCAGFRKMIDEIDLEVVEAKVTAWAAGHPEPVYPTWAKYLEQFGFTPGALMLSKECFDVDCEAKMRNIWLMTTHIPADIAEKLGIEPKEG